ncbi:MAG: 2-oxoacid:ferredoxin oxidoreductase subunit beta [Bacteroidales bacterium]
MSTQYTAKDFKNEQQIKWCPGCGDFAVLNCLHKAMAEIGVAPNNTAVISGIGCSSRLPYYMGTYGFHTIHGRGSAIATGVKVANPSLSVWQITGDGDCLAIGGNHFIHAVRRNIDINIVLLNNKIYGLTKGQYSPTTERGYVTKSSPFGTVEDPFVPAELAFGARGNFFARSLDIDLPTTTECMIAASEHKGTAVIEVLQNCVIFTDGIHKYYSDKEGRPDRTILLKQGEKMVFGKNNNKGIVLDGFNLKVVTIGEDGYTLDDVLVHDATTHDNTLHFKLASMEGPEFPLALGVIRNVEAINYDQAVVDQIHRVQDNSKIKSFNDLMMSGNVWEVK